MFKSIRAKLTFTYIAIVLSAIALISVFLLSIMGKYYQDYNRESMAKAGSLVAEFSVDYLKRGADTVALSVLAEDMSRQINARILITDHEGRVVGDSLRTGGYLGVFMQSPELEEAQKGNIGSRIQRSPVSKELVMQVAIPVMEDERILGAVILSSSLYAISETLAAVRSFLITATVIVLVLVGFGAALIAKTFTNPIEKLTKAARDMAAGRFEGGLSIYREDEIGLLVRQFNEMSRKVSESNKRLRDFITNASHELRTPLATINLLVSSLKDCQEEKELREEFIVDIEHETSRLISLVEDLLNLARLERGEVTEKRVFDLASLVKSAAEGAASRAKRRGLVLEAVFPEPEQKIQVLGNESEIKQVLHNLLDNAIKYTPEGGNIKIEARAGVDEALVSVSDTGCGIPAEDLEKVFERFYRVDKARSRGMGGTGLGLSICREIITNHGGEIWAESGEGRGTVFYFVLPLADVNKN